MALGDHIKGYMDLEELEWLCQTAQEMESIIEIGSWYGRSTFALCSGCKGTVYAVDHFKGLPEDPRQESGSDVYGIFRNNMKDFKNLVTMSCDSYGASVLFDKISRNGGQVDMVFIDGSHLRFDVEQDLRLWVPRATKLVCGHDYTIPGVQVAVNTFFSESGLTFGPGSIWKRRVSHV
jgi:hypothetical protein